MALTPKKIENGLLAHHLFPRIAKRGDEFPPCFVSAGFSAKVANKLIALKPNRSEGYGVVGLRSTRYDLAPRNMEVLHPRAFAKIVRQLRVSWDNWKAIEFNPSSGLRLAEHSDGRIFSMVGRADPAELLKAGGRFFAKVDITNFYGSIYTHAIPWAVHGVASAKAKRNHGADWANSLDMEVRRARRLETNGISTGPGTSAIVGEIMLGAVDEHLRANGYEFLRFIDDYYFVGTSHEKASGFVRAVRDELDALKLAIHPGKTIITELPVPLRPSWMRDLRLILRGRQSAGQLLDLLDRAIESRERAEEDGELRYALVTVEEVLNNENVNARDRLEVIDRLLSIGFLRPIAIGTACRLLAIAGKEAILNRAATLNSNLREHAYNRRTDAATWLLYTLTANSVEIEAESVDAVVQSRDCMAMVILTCEPAHIHVVVTFIAELEKQGPLSFKRDEYWLLYYQLALNGERPENVPQDYYEEFQPLLDEGISFIDLGTKHQYYPRHTQPQREAGSGRSIGGGLDPYA